MEPVLRRLCHVRVRLIDDARLVVHVHHVAAVLARLLYVVALCFRSSRFLILFFVGHEARKLVCIILLPRPR